MCPANLLSPLNTERERERALLPLCVWSHILCTYLTDFSSSLLPSPPAALPSLVSTLLCLGCTMLHAAPLPEFSGDQDFQQFLQKDLEYIRKIKGDVAQVQELVCTTLQLCNEEELMLVKQKLGISPAPLDQCHSKSFQDACFSQIRDGLQAYHGHLALLLQLLPAHSGLVDALRLDVSNLSTNIQQQMEDLGLNTVTYPKAEGQGTLPSLSSDFDKQASGFIISANFKRFLEAAFRALRHLTLV
uniref:Colony stimulating factor 3 n=1 Tax=Chelydra serpentina TaxID=8475 RepID=A0A8C3T3X6_CHESE